MRFSTVIFTLANLGAAFAAVEQPAGGAEGLFQRAAEPVIPWQVSSIQPREV